jgi:hypothetical protein
MTDQNITGPASLIVSLASGLFCFIASTDISEVIRGIAGLVSIAAGVMAIRHYYYSTKKNKSS